MTAEEKMKAEFLSEEFIMEFTGLTRKTIKNLRCSGSDRIPPFKKVGARYVYPLKDFQTWINRQQTNKGVA